MFRIEDVRHGLPGLGVAGKKGAKGEKGESIYIGYLRSFFDGEYKTDASYGYIRIKNQDNGSESSDASYYYRHDENFYRKIRGIDDTIDKMLTFSIYNLRGVYYKNTPNGVSSAKTWQSIGTDSSRFYKRKANIGDALSYGTSGWMSETIPSISFDVKLHEKYIEERNYNNFRSNYSNALVPDVFVPTYLKSMYHAGDILYIQDDITGNIINFVIVTPDIVGCSFEKFLTLEFNSVDVMTNTFKDLFGRGVVDKKIALPVMNMSRKVVELDTNGRFRKNFVSRNVSEYNMNLVFNNDDDNKFLRLKVSENGDFEKKFDLDYDSSVNRISGHEDNIVFKAKEISFSNLYVKNIDTNLNIREYHNDDIKFIDFCHVESIGTGNLTVERGSSKFLFRVDKKSYVTNGLEKSSVGIEVYRKTSENESELWKKVETFGDVVDFEIKDDDCWEGENVFEIVVYAKGKGTTKYCSCISELNIECKIDNENISVVDYHLSKGSHEIYGNEEEKRYFDFEIGELSCERNNDFKFSVTSKDENIVISEMYLNNNRILSGSNNVSDFGTDSWITLGPDSQIKIANDFSNVSFENLVVDSNIPNIENEVSNTVKEYFGRIMDKGSDYQIGSGNLNRTNDREIVLTVIGFDEVNKQKVKETRKIYQSGIGDFLNDVSVSFSDAMKELEDWNKSEKGVMCNQFQYTIDGNIEGFNNEMWGEFLDNPEMTVYLDLSRDIEKEDKGYYYVNDTNLNNIQIYSMNDVGNAKNNAVKVEFGWMNGDGIVSCDSDVEDIEKSITRMSYNATTSTTHNNIVFDNGWIVFNDVLKRNSTLIPQGINLQITDKGINGITFGKDKFRLYTKCEIANPIPMELNFKWRVVGYEIKGVLKEEFDSDEQRKEFVFFKDMSDNNVFSDEKVLSSNKKFVINPVSVVMCPEKHENDVEIKGSIKKVGAEESIKYSVGIVDVDERLKKEYETKDFSNFEVRNKILNKQNIQIPIIENYFPKKKNLQDNVVNLSVKSKKVDFNKDERYDNILKRISGNDAYRRIYNLVSDRRETKYSDNYLALFFDADVMLPQFRGGDMTFYYNNTQYPSNQYSQWRENTPLWVSFDSETEIVDSSLHESRHVWNIEYEVSDEYSNDKVSGGVLTKSGNGFLYTDEKYDIGQYDVDGLYSLEETREKSDEEVLKDEVVSSIVEPKGFKNQPKAKKFFRSLVKRLDWVYPNFYEKDGDMFAFPYYPVNSYVSDKDCDVMEGFMDHVEFTDSNVDFENVMEDFKNSFNDTESFMSYKSRKYENECYYRGDKFKGNKINMLIPYNRMFDVYPRVCTNLDMGENVRNIFMLQQPSVIKEGNYIFNKTYFEDDGIGISVPWNL